MTNVSDQSPMTDANFGSRPASSWTPAEWDWLAARYVCGELSPGDAASFETQLADEPAAQEALVHASRLVCGLQAGPRTMVSDKGTVSDNGNAVLIPPRSRKQRPERARWAVAATVAALLLVGLFLNPTLWQTTSTPDAGTAATLVGLWHEHGQSLDDGSELDTERPIETEEVPAWLLAAVSLEQNGDMEDGPFQSDAAWEEN
jgi:ferric-dicitrate binding protein FerR (iron transport regulator)